MRGFEKVFRALAILSAVCLPALGCFSGKFFVPTCQETNTCSGGSGSYSSYAYVANLNVGTLTAFPLPTTPFTSLSGSQYNLGTGPSALAGTPNGTFLYVATLAGPIFVYSIGAGGALTEGNSAQPVVSALAPTYMTVDPSGNWLFIVNSSSNTLLEYQINTSTGVLTPSSQTPIALSTGLPTQIYVTPNDQNVYVGLGTGGLDTFTFTASNGVLSNHFHVNTRLSGASSDNSISSDNNSAYLFVGEAGSGVRVLTIGSAGSLSEIAGSPFLTQSQLGPSSILVDPTNAFVYVAYSTSNDIVGYTLGSGGTLSQLGSSPFVTGSQPTSISLDSTGSYLLAVCKGGNPDLQVFSFDTTTAGKLDSVVATATGTDPAGALSLSVVR